MWISINFMKIQHITPVALDGKMGFFFPHSFQGRVVPLATYLVNLIYSPASYLVSLTYTAIAICVLKILNE